MASRSSRASEVPRGIDKVASKTISGARSQKSRSGCVACKAKRLKCDESRPSCKQCLRRHVQCPGYKPQYRWSTRHEIAQPPQAREQQSPFWPENEHAALLGTLPDATPYDASSLDCTGQGHAGEQHEASASSPGVASVLSPQVGRGTYSTATVSSDAPGSNEGATGQDSGSLAQNWPTTAVDESDDFQVADIGVEFCEDQGSVAVDEAWLNDLISEPWASLAQPQNSQPEDEPVNLPLVPATAAAPPASLKYTPVHLPTVLVEHWFSDVCPMWSAFDSPNNRYRQMAYTAWQDSEAVFYTLQSMSAAYLVDSLPHLKNAVALLSAQAVRAIQRELQAQKALGRDNLPTGLLLAIFAMGTSVCWTDTRQLGLWFLEQAQGLLSHYAENAVGLEASDYKDLLHFREALVYWEMLGRALGWDSHGTLKSRRELYRQRLRKALRGDDQPLSGRKDSQRIPLPLSDRIQNPQELTIHPWTGISTDVQHIFGLVMLLCRDNRVGNKDREARTSTGLSNALCDIELARDLESELLETHLRWPPYQNPPGSAQQETGDRSTPISHLIETAEAYRLASLLQLYQTFSELEVQNALKSSTTSTATNLGYLGGNPDMQRESNLLRLALQLVECLQRIPAESGARCIQPLLYISAASGLKFDTCAGSSPRPAKPIEDGTSASNMNPFFAADQPARLDVALLSSPTKLQDAARLDATSMSLTKCTVEVSRARRFVVNRLHALQRSLPPRPIGVALDLVKAIWAAYDNDFDGTGTGHWIDTMVEKGLETLFG